MVQSLIFSQRAIGLAEQYIVSQYNDEEVMFCNYALALSTAALATSTDSRVRSNVTSMVTELKSRIQDSRNCECSMIYPLDHPLAF